MVFEARALVAGVFMMFCVNMWWMEIGGERGKRTCQPTSKAVGLRNVTCESLGVHAIAFILRGQIADGLGCEPWHDESKTPARPKTATD